MVWGKYETEHCIVSIEKHALAFLQNNLLWIAGSPQNRVMDYYLGYHTTFQGANEGFKFVNDQRVLPANASALSRQSAAPIDNIYSVQVSVHNVRMIPTTESVDISQIQGYELNGNGPDIMITGQLSACAFVVQQINPGRLVVAHLQPPVAGVNGAPVGGHQMPALLRQSGRFSNSVTRDNGKITHVFGLGDYSARAHVIGIRSGGAWKIYAQLVAGGSGPVTGTHTII
jgi:hypothetical protein